MDFKNITPPKAFKEFQHNYEEVAGLMDSLGEKINNMGPLDEKTVRLIKTGISIGAGHEGAVYSDVKKALAAGASVEEIRQIALLCILSCGFPRAMAGLSWINKIIDDQS